MKCLSLRARPRFIRLPLSLLILTGIFVSTGAFAEDATVEKKAKPKILFSPDVEAKFTKFIGKAKEAKSKVWATLMKAEIAKIVKLTGLNDEGAKALEAPAKQAADACLDGWAAKVRESMQPMFLRQPEQAVMIIEQMMAQTAQYANGDWFGDYTRPPDHPIWTEALHHTLTPEQAAIWDKSEADRKQQREEKIADFLKAHAETMREQYSKEILVKSASIQHALALPKDRADQLDAIAKNAAGDAVQKWMKHADKMLLGMSDSLFAQLVKTGDFYMNPGDDDENDVPADQSAWKQGLAKFLTPEENKKLEADRDEFKTKRVKVMGQAMISVLDEKIAFTASQRQQLQPVTERLVREQESFFPDSDSENRLSPELFYAATSGAKAEEMKPILDDIQWKRWQELSVPKTQASKPPAPDAATTLPSTGTRTDQEIVENAISDFLYEKEQIRRRQVTAAGVLKAEDAVRVAGLPADVASRLHTAALGSVEEPMNGWRTYTDQMVRAQLQDVNAQNVQQRLQTIQSYFFQQNNYPSSGNNSIWEKAVKAALTKEQQAAWQKETDARKEFRENMIPPLITAEFARRNMLTLEQWTKFEPLITKILKDYGQEITSSFSSQENTSWYLQYYMMFMPFAGIPEKDIKALLTKEQWDRWTTSQEYSNSTSYWENVKEMHAQRVQQVDKDN